MKPNADRKPAFERRLLEIDARLAPPDADAAKQLLLTRYERLRAERRGNRWRVPAALAAGVLIGALGLRLYETQTSPGLDPLQALRDTRQAYTAGTPPSLQNPRATGTAATLELLLGELETADDEAWIDAIRTRLERQDWQQARALTDAFERRVRQRQESIR